MKRWIPILLVALAALGCTMAPAAQKPSQAQRADIERLLAVSGAEDLAKQMGKATAAPMLSALEAAHPDWPSRAFDIIEEEVISVYSEHLGAFKRRIIPLYAEHFTPAEIKGLIAFYDTDLGRKTVTVMPLLTEATMQLSQQWSQALTPTIEARVMMGLEAEGIKLK